ncbi:N-acetylneuraminate synthase family protein [Arthrobacter globiformis]|uniref:N-acetylneuraminate synthase family protein n=1 Tax=Arthrobacter globiformis TaxID=1665 RepID=UPI002791BCF0|nr:N-acetylneuraminate synthase family protein [Arthrobacter globiformis]MDQ0619537.1 N,N'-diacetyllegionaminate synthase [Arthrobacter globiformis]
MTTESKAQHVTFGPHRIGAVEEVFIIAEAGVNHDGDVAVAHELIDMAADTGANAVKFQTFKPEALVTEAADTTPYQKKAGFAESQSEMLRRLTLPESAWVELRDHCSERGITFLSTPFDYDSARMLADIGVPGLKIGSGELTNTPYLAAIAEFGIPMIVSTGMGTREEVAAALEATAKAPATVLLHCVSAYPAPLDEANLLAIPSMRTEFGVEVGWSDHTPGSLTAIAATALGATLLEKHITTDKTRNGPDHSASLEKAEFEDYVRSVRGVSRALGDGHKRRMPSEEANAGLVRRSFHAVRDIAAGTVITAADIAILRPEGGLRPSAQVVGRPAGRDIKAGTPLVEQDLG